MKKLIVVLTLVAFALTPAVQAGEDKDSPNTKIKIKAPSAEKAKIAESADTAKLAVADKPAQTACATACCEKNNFTKKTAKPAEKGGMLLAKR
ncbi:MAG TPA: hypothetical protein VJW76_01115 [Verrucomicrobiae bacterium]|nr:hypothetical protein [Verrucomicrobiae bacterium]